MVYVGDVPIDSTVAGQALLYRMLREYPADRLLVLEDEGRQSNTAQRLPGVEYRTLRLGDSRRVPGRLAGPYHAWRALRCAGAARSVARLCRGFAPEAVLVVAQWEGWLAGVAFARSAGLKLHLIVHDDWPNTNSWPRPLARLGDAVFADRYRTASSRLCVSPYMEEEYRRRYAAPGTVLLPLRDPTATCATAPAARRADASRFTVAYAGTLYTAGYTALVRLLADALGDLGGRLLLFSPLSREAAARNGLAGEHVDLRGFVPAHELRDTLRREADALFLAMSFLPHEATAMRLNFPSKLTEYTAVGLPIVVQGPPGTSAVRWAQASPDAAMVVEEPSGTALRKALAALASDGDLWHRLATGALRAAASFDYSRGRDQFFEALVRTETRRRHP
jgi:glycosyltransferase involved in cell wall biosynthesis